MGSGNNLVEQYWGARIARIVKGNEKYPSVFIGVFLGSMLLQLLIKADDWWHDMYHSHLPYHGPVHMFQHTAEQCMYFFFAHLGTHVSIKVLRKSGVMLGSMTLAGVIGPTIFTATLFTIAKLTGYADISWTMILALSVPAMATDVAFSLGTHKLSRIGGVQGERHVEEEMTEGLGIGDDVLGIIALTGLYSTFDNYTLLFLWCILMVAAYVLGELGEWIDRSVRVQRVGDQYLEIEGAQVQYIKHIIRINTVFVWCVMMLISTVGIVGMGVSPVLGGCLIIIFAPEEVKAKISAALDPIVVVVLLFFGMSAGLMVDVLNPAQYTYITALTFIGANWGKHGSIFNAGILARRFVPADSPFKNMPTGQIFHMASQAAETGTVSIFFVQAGLKAGMLTQAQASEAILGFMLTIPAGLAWTLLGVISRRLPGPLGWFGKWMLDNNDEFERAVTKAP